MWALLLCHLCIHERSFALISGSNSYLRAGRISPDVSVQSPRTITELFLPRWVAHTIFAQCQSSSQSPILAMDERGIHKCRLCPRSLPPKWLRGCRRLEIDLDSKNMTGRVIAVVVDPATFHNVHFSVGSTGCNDVTETAVFCFMAHRPIRRIGGDRPDPDLAGSVRL